MHGPDDANDQERWVAMSVDGARYFFGVFMIAMLPAALGYWFLVHPFVGFWRGLGKRLALTILFTLFLGVAYVLYLLRTPLLGEDYGTNYWLLALSIPLYVIGTVLDRQARRHLKLHILVGGPELASADEEQEPKLLQEGIYARVRHPRYLAINVGIVAWALFINYQGVYVMVPLFWLGLYLVVLLEESELRERFGEEYEHYCERVPRLLPRLSAPR